MANAVVDREGDGDGDGRPSVCECNATAAIGSEPMSWSVRNGSTFHTSPNEPRPMSAHHLNCAADSGDGGSEEGSGGGGKKSEVGGRSVDENNGLGHTDCTPMPFVESGAAAAAVGGCAVVLPDGKLNTDVSAAAVASGCACAGGWMTTGPTPPLGAGLRKAASSAGGCCCCTACVYVVCVGVLCGNTLNAATGAPGSVSAGRSRD